MHYAHCGVCLMLYPLLAMATFFNTCPLKNAVMLKSNVLQDSIGLNEIRL